MLLTPIKSNTAAATGGTTPTAPAAPNASAAISTQDFMQLLSTEMANQDPMQPMDPTQTMTQLAQFSTLQQTTILSQTQGLATANSFLGTQVTLPGTNGNAPVVGTVSAIDSSNVSSGGAPLLVVNGAATEVPLTSVTQITYPSAAAAATAAAAAAAAAAASPTATATAAAAAPAPAVSPKSAVLQFLSQLIP